MKRVIQSEFHTDKQHNPNPSASADLIQPARFATSSAQNVVVDEATTWIPVSNGVLGFNGGTPGCSRGCENVRWSSTKTLWAVENRSTLHFWSCRLFNPLDCVSVWRSDWPFEREADFLTNSCTITKQTLEYLYLMFLPARGQSAALLHRPRCAQFQGEHGERARAKFFGCNFEAKSQFVLWSREKKKPSIVSNCQKSTNADCPPAAAATSKLLNLSLKTWRFETGRIFEPLSLLTLQRSEFVRRNTSDCPPPCAPPLVKAITCFTPPPSSAPSLRPAWFCSLLYFVHANPIRRVSGSSF